MNKYIYNKLQLYKTNYLSDLYLNSNLGLELLSDNNFVIEIFEKAISKKTNSKYLNMVRFAFLNFDLFSRTEITT